MNTIPEDRILSQTGSTGTWTRSGIRMGSSGLLQHQQPLSSVQPQSWFSSSNLPSFRLSEAEADDQDDDEEASDWEAEVSDRGELFYVLPIGSATAGETETYRTQRSGRPTDDEAEKAKKGGKLSRLVRRRESKRDRNRTLPVTAKKSASMKSAVNDNDDDVRRNCESSDNDSSSTYGQIKTFETLFESSAAAASMSMLDKRDNDDNGSSSGSSGGEVTEIHEVFIKFNAKQFKSQLPHFQMVMNADNPRNSGALLHLVLGIVAEKRPSLNDEASAVLESSIRLAGFIEASPAARANPALKSGDILRSVDGFHVTLDNVNSFLLQKLTANPHSSSCKVKLIIQRPKRRRKQLGRIIKHRFHVER